MDEVHNVDARSQVALRFLRGVANADGRDLKSKHVLIELTATGYDLRNCESVVLAKNPLILDKKISGAKEDFYAMLDQLCDEKQGCKVVVFLPVVVSKGPMSWASISLISRRLRAKGAFVVSYHRKTAQVNHAQARMAPPMDKTMFVLTTNMSEVGVNLDADICIDLQLQTVFQADPGNVIFQRRILPITQAQLVQRRGRVGRGKPGEYWYAKSLNMEGMDKHVRCVDEYDFVAASRVLSLRPMRPIEDSEYEDDLLGLSQAQLRAWTRDLNIQGLIATYLKYDATGKLRSEDSRKAVIKAWTTGKTAVGFHVNGVNLRSSFYDDRDKNFLLPYFRSACMVGAYVEEKTTSDEEESIEAVKKCRMIIGGPVVGLDHQDWSCVEGHNHVCRDCGHCFGHTHPINPDEEHVVVCGCCSIGGTGSILGWTGIF
jgi:hypothetical protein